MNVIAAAGPLIDLALAEDLGQAGDVTSRCTVPADTRGQARLVARQAGVLAGLDIVREVFHRIDPAVHFRPALADGARLEPDLEVARLRGPARALLAGERTALNFVQRLSGVATQAARYAAALDGTGTRVLDTRKTTPGWRALEKYAVQIGGGRNHRHGLYDMILIKDNHEVAAGGLGEAIRRALAGRPAKIPIEVEVRTLAEVEAALDYPVEGLLFDNMSPELVAEGVSRVVARSPHPWVEVSGGVTLESIRRYALPGVDFISVGALTHSAPSLDLALDFEPLDGEIWF